MHLFPLFPVSVSERQCLGMLGWCCEFQLGRDAPSVRRRPNMSVAWYTERAPWRHLRQLVAGGPGKILWALHDLGLLSKQQQFYSQRATETIFSTGLTALLGGCLVILAAYSLLYRHGLFQVHSFSQTVSYRVISPEWQCTKEGVLWRKLQHEATANALSLRGLFIIGRYGPRK